MSQRQLPSSSTSAYQLLPTPAATPPASPVSELVPKTPEKPEYIQALEYLQTPESTQTSEDPQTPENTQTPAPAPTVPTASTPPRKQFCIGDPTFCNFAGFAISACLKLEPSNKSYRPAITVTQATTLRTSHVLLAHKFAGPTSPPTSHNIAMETCGGNARGVNFQGRRRSAGADDRWARRPGLGAWAVAMRVLPQDVGEEGVRERSENGEEWERREWRCLEASRHN
ncbi:unnamed protein product [Cutaneotrichosporon oleaginosum]